MVKAQREPTVPQLIPHKEELKTFVLGKFEKVITGDLGLPADQPTLARVMEVLALFQPFEIEGEAFASLLTKIVKVDAATSSRLMRVLVEGGVVFKRGRLYRLMPDVLGDYLIDRSCLGPSGRLSPFAMDVVDLASGQQLTNVVLNLGRLDWRRNEGDPSDSNLLASVWRKLTKIESEHDPKLDAALAVAPYQPRQALDYVAQLSERSEHVLISELLRDDVALARAFIAAAQRTPESPIADFASNAINELLTAEPDEARALVERLIGGAVRNLRQAAAWGYGGLRRDLTDPDYILLSRIVADDDDSIAGSGIRVGWSWRGSNPNALTEVMLKANVHKNARLADDLCMALTEMNKRPLPIEAIPTLLAKFQSIPELNGHWLEQFLADASERAGVETAKFFFDRVRRASTDETFNEIRPVNHGPWGHVPLRFSESPQLAEVLALTWAFLHEQEGGVYFDYNAANMFEAMFKPLGHVAVSFFDARLETASAVDLELMSKVLRNAPANFVFEHRDFVFRFLERCRIASTKVHKHATASLTASAGSGVRSGAVGEPSPQDLEMIDAAEKVLTGLSRASAAYATYDGIRKWGQWSVKAFELDDDLLGEEN